MVRLSPLLTPDAAAPSDFPRRHHPIAPQRQRAQAKSDHHAQQHRLHELKLIVDLMYEGGIANMNYSISNNAEYGEYVTGTEVINEKSREAMRAALKRIQTGEYAKMFILEGRTNYPSMTARRRLNAEHPIETVGAQLRAMMPWIAKNKLVDQTRN